MITKYNYSLKNGKVVRTPIYSFSAIEDLNSRIDSIKNDVSIKSIVNTTLRGEAERNIIEAEEKWFSIQTKLQQMDDEKARYEKELKVGDKYGNPLNPTKQKSLKMKINELTEGSVTIEREFYDHHTRTTHKSTEVVQTLYTRTLLERDDIEIQYPFLSGLRGISTAPARPIDTLDPKKEKFIKKALVRQEIDNNIGDDKDLIADMAKAINVLIKKVEGIPLNDGDVTTLKTYRERQIEIDAILDQDYK